MHDVTERVAYQETQDGEDCVSATGYISQQSLTPEKQKSTTGTDVSEVSLLGCEAVGSTYNLHSGPGVSRGRLEIRMCSPTIRRRGLVAYASFLLGQPCLLSCHPGAVPMGELQVKWVLYLTLMMLMMLRR